MWASSNGRNCPPNDGTVSCDAVAVAVELPNEVTPTTRAVTATMVIVNIVLVRVVARRTLVITGSLMWAPPTEKR